MNAFSPSEIFAALERLFNTKSWEQKFHLLEQEQAMLTSLQTDNILIAYIQQKMQEGAAQEETNFFSMHRQLLVRIREAGLPIAWGELMDALIPEDTKKTVWTAFNKFCNAKTLDEMKLVFAQERSTLLSEVTELFLQYMIAHLLQSREQDNEEQLNNIRKIGSFFESMRLGYEYKAWREMEKFISKVKTATENIVLALDALTQADSEEEIHVILEREKALLLTEKAEQVLGYIIQQAEQSPEADDDSLQALRYILQLLQHARKVGIEQAIQNMVVIKDDEPTKEHEGTLVPANEVAGYDIRSC